MKPVLSVIALVLFSASVAGQERILVRVAPREYENRAKDEAPVEFRLSSNDLPANRRLDPASLEVVRWDGEKPIGNPLAFRWYDDAIPYEFPDCEQNLSSTDGIDLAFTSRPRWGDYYNLLGDGGGGRLVWNDLQHEYKSSTYAITFRLLPEGERPKRLAPRGFTGDGACRCAPRGLSSTSVTHSRMAAADWNGDGLIDLLAGGVRGHILIYQNVGTKTEPKFGAPRLMMTVDGKPLDTGWTCAPHVVDWDGDGVMDLLCGTERNRILFYRNLGTNQEPGLRNEGFVTAGGEPIVLPVEPVPKSPKGVYTMDYYPVLDAVDWNGDSQVDLLAGGFITGRIFYYECVGKNADGTPKLETRGPLEADGQPLNVGDWAAAPTTGDFLGDGKRHLISGNMPLTEVGGDSASANGFLRLYENVGTRSEPKLVQRPFPRQGEFPYASMASPRAVDLNGDGLLDLAVSANENLFLYFNVGSKTNPVWKVHDKPLPSEWGSAPLPTWGVQFLDWNGDGRLDILSSLLIYINQGDGTYGPVPLLSSGSQIKHPGSGDGWTFTQLADLDGDGRMDLLYGTHAGNVWLHRNLDGTSTFEQTGKMLLMDDGKPIHVGPVQGQKMDFDVLQGARTTFAVADFDDDGRLDLVVGDTYGKVRAYRNTGDRMKPTFSAPMELGDMGIRMIPYAADWDSDGRIDIIGSSANGKVWWWRNSGKGQFDQHEPITMPEVSISPMAAVVDWNDDGDLDLFVSTAYGYTCWFDRSFLKHGYANAERVGKPR